MCIRVSSTEGNITQQGGPSGQSTNGSKCPNFLSAMCHKTRPPFFLRDEVHIVVLLLLEMPQSALLLASLGDRDPSEKILDSSPRRERVCSGLIGRDDTKYTAGLES